MPKEFHVAAIEELVERVRKHALWSRLRSFLVQQKLSAALMLAGVVLLGYVGSEYWAMHSEQQALRRQWQQQQARMPAAASSSAVEQDDGLTRVSIPKIDLDVIVLEGTNHKALRLGPGHLKTTPLPGETGNSVISAHRDTFFRHIYELNKGDLIQVRRSGRTYIFEVIGKKVVEPDDVSVIQNTRDARLTLITCYPTYYIGPAPERLVVFSKLVTDKQQGQQRAASSPAIDSRQGS